MSRIALVLALLCGAAYATEFKDCGSQATDVALSIEGCDIPPCELKSGEHKLLTLTFTPDHDIADLVADVDAIFGGVPIPWPGMNTKACDFMDGEQCPLKKGQVAKWAYPVYVDPLYPKMAISVRFAVKDTTGFQACAATPVVITA